MCPYIEIDTKDELADGRIAQNVGELTYAVTSQLAMFLDERLGKTSELHYEDLAVCLAALEGAKADLIERVLKPYEAKKAADNGDVWGRNVIDYVGGNFYGYKVPPLYSLPGVTVSEDTGPLPLACAEGRLPNSPQQVDDGVTYGGE